MAKHRRFRDHDDPTVASADRAYRHAKNRVDQLWGFFVHALVFVGVNLGLAVAAGGFDPGAGYFWGWGIGVAAHAVYTAAPTELWRQRMIERQLAKLDKHPR
jgi:hypothetical protein